jgi:glycolate oxidase
MHSSSPDITAPNLLINQFKALLGEDQVRDEMPHRELFGMDVYRKGTPPNFVIRPGDTPSLQAAVKLAASLKIALIPRGGGASYSDGYVQSGGPAILVDTSGLNQIEIDELNARVTVGAGVTWSNLKMALDDLGWRTPFWGPFSGLVATVGGTVSQNGISHGSGAYGLSAQSVLSIDVVLADGSLLSTGSAATGALPTLRHFGPDLTGLFTGDCGALGIKTAITLPLLRKKPAFATLSWSFENFANLQSGMRATAIEGLDEEHFALDAALSQGQIAREERAGRQTEIVAAVMKTKGIGAGLAQLAKMGLAGDRALKAADYVCHYIVEGVDEAEAKGRVKRLKVILSDFGSEIPNTVPEIVRGMPFAPLFNTLGPAGERWVPVHGVMAHSDALAFHIAFDAFLEERSDAMKQLGIWTGAMFETVGSSAFLYEIALYWPDAQSAYHGDVIDKTYLDGLPKFPENLEARAYVDGLKSDLIDLYATHNASHFQIGRAYPYATRLSEPALALMKAIKSQLDPLCIMNPGVLGL